MNKKNYAFYALFTYEDEGITIEFPDLPGCISCGYSTEEAITMAKEALALYLDGMGEEEIPKPTDFNKMKKTKSNQKLVYIEINI